MTDAEIRGRLLTNFYELRHNNDGWVPTSDINMSPDAVSPKSSAEFASSSPTPG